MAYQNGRLPASALALIPGTNQRIAFELLYQVVALRAAFKAHFGKNLAVTDGYRDEAGQVAARNRYLSGKGAYAVPPGTSNHGWGKAIDFGSRVNILGTDEHDWMVANAPKFGFVWLRKAGNGSIEPWHFDGSAVPASNYIDFPGVPGAPVVTPPESVKEWDELASEAQVAAAVHNGVVGVLRAREFKNATQSRDFVFVTIAQWYVDLLGRAGNPTTEVGVRTSAVVDKGGDIRDQYAAIYNSDEAKNYRAAQKGVK